MAYKETLDFFGYSNMKTELTSEELKSIELQLLDVLADYCQEHNLRYYLAYGTLLGAMRHKGFIPWDDDIDVMMPRPDYDKLINTFNQNNTNPEVGILSHVNDNRYYLTFSKLISRKTVLKEEVA